MAVAGSSPLAQVVSTHGEGKLRTPLHVRDLAPLPASDSTGSSLYFLVIAWMLGGYVGATTVGMMLGGMRAPDLRRAAIRLGLLAGYAASSGLLGALLIGQGLPPSAALSAARGVVYLGGANLTGPLTVLATYAAAGSLLTLAGTAWHRRRAASRASRHAAQVPSAAEPSLAP
ncbi:MAG: hypothetical protein ACRDNO_27830 [Trebonia sp.]